MLAVTLAWDDALSWTWAKAISTLESTMDKVSSKIVRLQKEVSRTFILSNHHSPSKMHWDLAVKKALEIINRSSTPLTKVVLARSSRVITATNIDPIAWLACLKVFFSYYNSLCSEHILIMSDINEIPYASAS